MDTQITLHPIHHPTDPYLPEVEKLYLSAFPEYERRDTVEQRLKITEEKSFCPHALLLAKRFFGLLNWWEFDRFLYVEHFATLPEHRGQGLGTATIDFLKQTHPVEKPVLIEVEPPTTSLATRRINFYQRMGLTLLETPYLQPPYRLTDSPTPMRLMHLGTIDQLTLLDMIRVIHQRVYNTVLLQP